MQHTGHITLLFIAAAFAAVVFLMLWPRWQSDVSWARRLRQFGVLAHVGTSVGTIGAVAAFLTLAILGQNGSALSAANLYPAMNIIAKAVILPLLVLSLSLGVAQAVLTPWGLLRHSWIIWKFGLTVFALVILLVELPEISAIAAEAQAGLTLSHLKQGEMVVHAAGALALLGITTALSIYKPGGRARRAGAQAG